MAEGHWSPWVQTYMDALSAIVYLPGMRGTGMAAIIGLGRPIILLWMVQYIPSPPLTLPRTL